MEKASRGTATAKNGQHFPFDEHICLARELKLFPGKGEISAKSCYQCANIAPFFRRQLSWEKHCCVPVQFLHRSWIKLIDI